MKAYQPLLWGVWKNKCWKLTYTSQEESGQAEEEKEKDALNSNPSD